MSLFFPAIQSKIPTWEAAQVQVRAWQAQGERVVFTNGCFDLIHYGHLQYLAAAAQLGTHLVVGLNSDASVRALKGDHRPIKDFNSRVALMASLSFVDLVVVFEALTPLELIQTLSPDVLVKGGDWKPAQIVGADWVLSKGWIVQNLPYLDGFSTTYIEKKILDR